MHRLWLDTNIIVDYLILRKPFDSFSLNLFLKIDEKKIIAYTSIINLIHAHYQLRKKVDELTARNMIMLVSKIVNVSAIPNGLDVKPLSNNLILDFEDAVQYELALLAESNFFITRNEKNFLNSPSFTVCNAETYLDKYSLVN